jgi:two-component system, NtrC family, nitrogen regulation sensor histidine kinase NtrY
MMFSKNLYYNIVLRVLLIVLTSALLGFFLIVEHSVRLGIISALVLTLLTINLVLYLNRTNRKIRFFFDSVRNDDSNLSFPQETGSAAMNDLSRSMNKVNYQIQQLKIENRQQEQYFGTLLEHTATGIITFNDKGFILHANSAARHLLSIDVLTHLQQIERKNQKLFEAIKSIKPDERRLVAVVSENGEIQLSLKATSFKTNENELVILSVQDIKNELDEKEVESWMKLIRVLMHEIMNSITPITSLSESLSNIYSKDGKPVVPDEITVKTIGTTLQGLNVIKEQGRGLMSFVESYRKLTRVPEPVKKLFPATELLNRVKILYDSLEGSEASSLNISLPDQELSLYADQNLISQVLINLLKNALEASNGNPDSTIQISVSCEFENHPLICVSDNGPGIPSENLDEIFVPFFTTRQNGSGIGLSISRQIMRAHGGNLKVRSIPDKETVFCLSF